MTAAHHLQWGKTLMMKLFLKEIRHVDRSRWKKHSSWSIYTRDIFLPVVFQWTITITHPTFHELLTSSLQQTLKASHTGASLTLLLPACLAPRYHTARLHKQKSGSRHVSRFMVLDSGREEAGALVASRSQPLLPLFKPNSKRAWLL